MAIEPTTPLPAVPPRPSAMANPVPAQAPVMAGSAPFTPAPTFAAQTPATATPMVTQGAVPQRTTIPDVVWPGATVASLPDDTAPAPVARAVAPLNDWQIVQLAQQGRLHRTMEENTVARDAALLRIAAQEKVDAPVVEKVIEDARVKTSMLNRHRPTPPPRQMTEPVKPSAV